MKMLIFEMLREEREYISDTAADAAMNGMDEERHLDNSCSVSVGKKFAHEHYVCDKCKSIFEDEKYLESHHGRCHEESEPDLVSSDNCEETFECDKCDVVFVDKTDLRTHMN